jgi:hypothetical protein
VWTDAAYLYAAVAAGGMPGAPEPGPELAAQLQRTRGWIEQAEARMDQVIQNTYVRDAQRAALLAKGDEARAWWDSARWSGGGPAFVPAVFPGPGAEVAMSLRTAAVVRRRQMSAEAGAVMAQAERQVAWCAQQQQALLDAEYADATEADALAVWLRDARAWLQQSEAQQAAAGQAYTEAVRAWRAAAGRLLIEARAGHDDNAAARIAGIDLAHGPERAGAHGSGAALSG